MTDNIEDGKSEQLNSEVIEKNSTDSSNKAPSQSGDINDVTGEEPASENSSEPASENASDGESSEEAASENLSDEKSPEEPASENTSDEESSEEAASENLSGEESSELPHETITEEPASENASDGKSPEEAASENLSGEESSELPHETITEEAASENPSGDESSELLHETITEEAASENAPGEGEKSLEQHETITEKPASENTSDEESSEEPASENLSDEKSPEEAASENAPGEGEKSSEQHETITEEPASENPSGEESSELPHETITEEPASENPSGEESSELLHETITEEAASENASGEGEKSSEQPVDEITAEIVVEVIEGEEEILPEAGEELLEDNVKIEEKVDKSGINVKNVITKKLSKDQLEKYLESRTDGKKRKIIIKKSQKKNIEIKSADIAPVAEEKKVIETEDDQQDQEKSYIDLAADYALPSSEAGYIKQEDLVPSDWKEKKISSYIKKPEGTPALKPFEEGKVLSEKYEILDKLSEDINGVIYKVKDLKEKDEKNVIKSIKEIQYIPGEGISEDIIRDTLKRLDRMTSFLIDVDHPNLSKIYDYFSIVEENKSARFFIVTDYIEGNTLEELLKVYSKEGTPIPMKTAFSIMEKLCDALYYLHNKKPFPVGFGDLKPANVMMALDGSIKFINYGIGTFFDKEKDGTMASRGTIGYAAPEQRGVDFTNTKADIFALGVTVYYMLTGVDPEEHPYEFKPLRKHKRFVSEKVQRFIDRCLEIHPDNRPDINAVKKLMEKMDLHELDLSSVLKKKEEEIKKQEEETKELEPPPPAAISQEKVEEIITDFKVKNPFIASRYGISLIILFLVICALGINTVAGYISSIPRKGNFLYMTSGSNKVIKELNLLNNKISDFMSLPKNAGPLVYSKKNRSLYTCSLSDSILYEISIDKSEIVRKKKLDKGVSYILLSKDENFIYVLNSLKNNLSFIRIEDFQEARSQAQVGNGPSYASLSPSGDRLFITCEKNESVTVFSTKNFIVKNNLNFAGSKPKGAIGNAEKAYVCFSGTGKLAVIDLKSGNILHQIPLSAEPVSVLLNQKDTKKLYVITDGSVEIFDTDNYRSVAAPKYTGFKAESSIFCDNGIIYILGHNNYLKTCSIGIYDIYSGNLNIVKDNFILNFITFVRI